LHILNLIPSLFLLEAVSGQPLLFSNLTAAKRVAVVAPPDEEPLKLPQCH
jgi:hypothetical protein